MLLIRDSCKKWVLPKGHIEEGEGSAQAALREVREETGLQDLSLGPDLGEIDWSFLKAGQRIHKISRFYLMASLGGDPFPQRSEGITECRWFPSEDASRTISYDNARTILLSGVGHIHPAWVDAGAFWHDR